jgi:hypothetical protein
MFEVIGEPSLKMEHGIDAEVGFSRHGLFGSDRTGTASNESHTQGHRRRLSQKERGTTQKVDRYEEPDT